VSLFSNTPDELDGAARTIENAAARLLGVRAVLERQCDVVGNGAWQGPIATMGLLSTAAHTAQVAVYVNALEQLAASLRRDADHSRDEISVLRSIETRVRNAPVPLPNVHLPRSGDPEWRAVETAYRNAGLL